MQSDGKFENGAFIAVRDEPQSSVFSRLYLIAGLIAILMGIYFLVTAFSAETSFGDHIRLGASFFIPGVLLSLTRFWDVNWDDHRINYRTLKGKNVTADFNRIKDWGRINSIAGTWVKFENAPTLYFTQFMSNYDYLETMIDQKITRSHKVLRPDQSGSPILRELVVPGAIILMILPFYLSTKF